MSQQVHHAACSFYSMGVLCSTPLLLSCLRDSYFSGDSSDDGFHGNHDDYYEGDDFEDEGGDDEGGDSDDCVALFGACATTANCCIDLECTDEGDGFASRCWRSH